MSISLYVYIPISLYIYIPISLYIPYILVANFVFISTSNQSSNPTTPFIILTPAIAKGNFALCVDPPNKESKSYNVHFKVLYIHIC